ncbi:MAG: DNA mismatch repair endonuclease MutL, partial [Acetatifactor sp.]|nr:DNA mismatch repair endonuclease MutL [Acetatifactor sp.]
AVDAGATAIAVEIKDGGIEFIRVTDNGCGMDEGQVRKAFLRHATSKIRDAGDLMRISSLGFRGEALSSIAAVAKVEVITKTRDSLTGSRIVLEGAVEKEFSQVGAPEGTTFLVRNLFFNTPARRKFLKLPATEGGYIADLMEHLALSRPDISFKFQIGNQLRFHTTGNGDLKEVIYRLYGRDTAASLVPVLLEQNGNRVEGYLGKPSLVRSNRNFEIYFINGRFIRSNLIARALEEGYREYLMQHKFPLCVLHISMDTGQVDVNVHPNKMDVRFSDGMTFCKMLSDGVHDTLKNQEMIPNVGLSDEREERRAQREREAERQKEHTPEPFEQNRAAAYRVMEENRYQAAAAEMPEVRQIILPPQDSGSQHAGATEQPGKQMNLFEEKILSVDNRSRYYIIGQVFDTYWMVQFEDKLLIIDQHAAHEKVKYERFMKRLADRQTLSQALAPPIIVSLSAQEETVLLEYRETFERLGFEIEAFGGREYALRSVPVDLYGCSEREMFLEVLDELDTGVSRGNFQVIEEKIASMSCKAAVKGNNRLSTAEAQELIDELLTLDNPYNCPHGRPTIVTISKYEMEKKFKRIV